MSETASKQKTADVRIKQFAYDHVDDAIKALCEKVTATGTEHVTLAQAPGRVLAEAVKLDRASPACNVSAMDGYALRMVDAKAGQKLNVLREVQAGEATCELPAGEAVRIFTGAMVPADAELVIQREHVREHVIEQADGIALPAELKVKAGQHIRYAGENGKPGDVLCDAGQTITAAILAAVSSVGMTKVLVYRKVRVGILVTGGEVLDASQSPEPWQIRDGNGPALQGLLGQLPWVEVAEPVHVRDDPDAMRKAMAELLETSDALLLTGGVSAGDYDFVPSVLKELGAEIVFHKLPIRPGKPVLGAVSKQGCLVLGLPGNPVSVMVTARRIAMSGLRVRGGFDSADETIAWAKVVDITCAPAGLTWFALVRVALDGQAYTVGGKGSGDWVSAAASDGFVEVPAGESMAGLRRFFAWPGR